MLTDAAVARYSRQILLAEVGGRGQARILSATVRVEGGGACAAFAGELLARAGVRVEHEPAPDTGAPCMTLPEGVTVMAHWTDDAVRVATVARPVCPTCRATRAAGPTTGQVEPSPSSAQIVGALVAGECLRVLLGLAPRERVLRLDLATSRCQPDVPPTTPGCPACGRPG